MDIRKIALLAAVGPMLCLVGSECNKNPAGAPAIPTVEFSTTYSTPSFMLESTASTKQVVDKNAGYIDLQVALSTVCKFAVTAPVMISSGSTAQSPTDYTLSQDSVLIPAGDSIGSFSLSVAAPTAYEKSKMIFLSLGTPSNVGLGVNRMDTVALVDVNGFGKRYKFADNELTGWTQDTNPVPTPFTVWRGDSLEGLWDGGAGLWLDRGCLVTMVQELVGPNDSVLKSCEVVAMDFGTNNDADSMYAYRKRTATIQIPGYDASVAIAHSEGGFGNIKVFAHFNEMYFELGMSGYDDQSASSSAAGQLLKILQQKVN